MQRFVPRRLWVAATILAASSAAIPATASAAATCAASNYAVAPLQSDVFYIDVQSSYLGSYVGYSVTNQTGASQANLWVRLENFAGGTVTPASGAATTTASALSTLASGAKGPSYAYLKAPVDTLTVRGSATGKRTIPDRCA